MAAYTTVEDVQAGFRALTDEEKEKAARLLEEAAEIIDTAALNADESKKAIVSCRMVRRAIGDSSSVIYPLGATQGSMSALGYAQSWTMQGGSSGELYLGKTDKQLLGIGNRIGSHSPLEDLAND